MHDEIFKTGQTISTEKNLQLIALVCKPVPALSFYCFNINVIKKSAWFTFSIIYNLVFHMAGVSPREGRQSSGD